MDDATRRSLAQVVQEVESERTTADVGVSSYVDAP